MEVDLGRACQQDTNTGRVPSGTGQRKIGRCGSSMLRPSPNHGTLWLHNDDDDAYGGDDDDDDEVCYLSMKISYVHRSKPNYNTYDMPRQLYVSAVTEQTTVSSPITLHPSKQIN